jgi:hypothetical protein
MDLTFFQDLPSLGARAYITAIIDGVRYVEEATVTSRQSIGGKKSFFTNGQMIEGGITLKPENDGWSALSVTARREVDVTVEFN